MATLFREESKFALWLEIETLAAEAMAAHGTIPQEAAAAIRARGQFDSDAIAQIERETRHDVIAFLTDVVNRVGPEARFLHQGMTSSDLLDTALSVQMVRALDIIIAGVDTTIAALRQQAFTHAWTVTIGRSHGMSAEPMSFGVKLAGFAQEFIRNRERLTTARQSIGRCAISGAVGTYATVSPEVEAYVAHKLGLAIEPHSTQIIPRDRHAEVFCALSLLSCAIERLAVEIRHLQRSEVAEVREAFGSKQKGSSAMPHKRNPILSENISGLARYVRGLLGPALENTILWHERDISHSSVERMAIPDVFVVTDFALHRLANLIAQLEVDAERMQDNVAQSLGTYASQRVLLALTQSGVSREHAYRLVQRQARDAIDRKVSLEANLRSDTEVTAHVPAPALRAMFDPLSYLQHTPLIMARVFANPTPEEQAVLKRHDTQHDQVVPQR